MPSKSKQKRNIDNHCTKDCAPFHPVQVVPVPPPVPASPVTVKISEPSFPGRTNNPRPATLPQNVLSYPAEPNLTNQRYPEKISESSELSTESEDKSAPQSPLDELYNRGIQKAPHLQIDTKIQSRYNSARRQDCDSS
jgi:hypothetical protein